MNESLALKSSLLQQCHLYIEAKIATCQEAIKGAQASANEETKSSAGDKYETGRAMAQLEIEKNTAQLHEAQKLKQALLLINPSRQTDIVQIGSVVKTTQQNYFISIAAGKLVLGGEVFYAISPASPIGLKLVMLKKGSSFVFNKTEITIIEVL